MRNPSAKFVRNALSVAVSMALLPMATVYAQNAGADAKGDNATLNLDQVVITASPVSRTKLKSTDSVSSVSAEQITRSGATNAAEILRTVPGVRSESSGGEGNANLTVRGAPISAGGTRYVQFQEDGLPVLLFGDIAFGTPDQFLRTDFTTDRVEVVRGGGSSTMVSNAPGGVVNFLSKTGREESNSVGTSVGIGSRLNRYDFNYGSSINDSTYFNIGGFYRNGEGGAQKTGFNSQDGGQLKASITKEFDKGNYVRLNFKSLSDKTPSLMPVPTSMDRNGNISPMRGIDPRTAYFINSSLSRDVTVDRNGNPIASNPADGLRVQSTAIGAEARFDLGDGWILTDKFRKAQNSGRFMALFPADNGITGNPNAFTATMFNTSLDNMDNMFNDMKVSKSFDAGGGKAVVTGGLFTGTQNVAQTWFWNQYSVGMSNTGGTIGAPITNGWNTWGGCCARTYDVRYNVNDPYAAVNWDSGPVSIDASVRQQNQSATGSYTSGLATNAGTALSGGGWDPKSTQQVNYKLSKTSYSFGGNYLLDKDTSVYARLSDGYNFSADRLLYGTALNGSAPISYNQLRQQELGVKARRGNFSFFGTFFLAQTNESNYEATTQKFTSNKYDAKGLELEMGYRMGGFRLNGGATITRARITASNTAAEVGKTPRRQADVVYAISPSYRMGDAEIGAAFVGTSKAYGDNTNTINMAGYMITNAFASYQFTKSLVGSMSVNNLFNTLGYTEVEGDGHAARAVPGRTVRASLRYNF